MKQIYHNVESHEAPLPLQVRNLAPNTYELLLCENIIESVKEGKIIFTYDMTLILSKYQTLDEIKGGLVRLKYNQDEEFALINKGILDSEDAKYLAYRSYVETCKNYADEWWNEEGRI